MLTPEILAQALEDAADDCAEFEVPTLPRFARMVAQRLRTPSTPEERADRARERCEVDHVVGGW